MILEKKYESRSIFLSKTKIVMNFLILNYILVFSNTYLFWTIFGYFFEKNNFH